MLSREVQEGPGKSGKVQGGPGMSRDVQGGPGGSRGVQGGPGIKPCIYGVYVPIGQDEFRNVLV